MNVWHNLTCSATHQPLIVSLNSAWSPWSLVSIFKHHVASVVILTLSCLVSNCKKLYDMVIKMTDKFLKLSLKLSLSVTLQGNKKP